MRSAGVAIEEGRRTREEEQRFARAVKSSFWME